MKKILLITTLSCLFMILALGTIQAATVGDIIVGGPNDTSGIDQINQFWGGWGAQTSISGVSCRPFTGAASPTASQISLSTANPGGGTLQITMYNSGSNPTTVSGYFNFNDSGTWQDMRVQQVTVPVGVWTTLNFAIPSTLAWEAVTTVQGTPAVDVTGTLSDGLQLWWQFGGGANGGPPPPSTIAVSEIKSVTNMSWTLQISGQPFDTYQAGVCYMWDTIGWSDLTTIAGVNCRIDLGTASPTINPLVITVDPSMKRMLVTYYDGGAATGFDIWANYNDGGSWQDLKIGNCPLTGIGWRTEQLNLSSLAAALTGLATSADVRYPDDFGSNGIPGVQMRFQPFDTGLGSFTQQIPIASIAVDDQPAVPVELSTFSAD